MGGRVNGSNFLEAGEFDVAYHEADDGIATNGCVRLKSVSVDSSRHDSTDNVTDQFDYEANPGESQDKAARKARDRYRFPGSEMTRELYERRGVDLNNNA